ncbi:MAG: sulfatase [Rhodothermia bacterium]
MAEVQSEVRRVELGRNQARPLLAEGWGRDHGVDSFVWGMGAKSILQFYLGHPRDLEVRLRCRPFRFENAPPQRLRIEVNGRRIGDIDFDVRGASEGYIRIPGDALRAGINELAFHYSYSHRPKDVLPHSDDYRPQAMQWNVVEFVNATDFGRPNATAGRFRSELGIPRHSRVDYFLRLQPGTSFKVEGISPWGNDDTVALEVVLQVEDSTVETVMRLDPPFGPSDPVVLPLPIATAKLIRLSLRAVAADPLSPREAGLRLINPVLTVAGPTAGEVPLERVRESVASLAYPTKRPNIVLYVIDTLRADHLGCYGYSKNTSPFIDAFAKEATLFKNPNAQSAWTKPSIASILTGLYPPVHGANSVSDVLSDKISTLAEVLRAADYTTAGFVTNSVLSPDYGFDQGFEHFKYLREKEDREFHVLSDEVNESVFSWLDHRPKEEPFSLFIHSMDPHAPYTPREPHRTEFAGHVREKTVGLLPNVNGLTWEDRAPGEKTAEELTALYDGEIAFNDATFGALLEKLRSSELLESSIVILVSDHGEEFGDHGRWQHGFTLFQEMLRVPLIIQFPDSRWAGRVVDDVVGQVDSVPTVLEFAGLEPPSEVQGRSLVRLARSAKSLNGSAPSFSFILKQRWRDVAAVTAGSSKLLWYRIYDKPRPRIALYDLSRDPKETVNIAARQPVLAGHLLTLLRSADISWTQIVSAGKTTMDQEMEERLRALGHIQ